MAARIEAQQLGPTLLPGTVGWNLARELSVETMPDPPSLQTLGKVGRTVEVRGPETFSRTILRIPVHNEDLVGIDAKSVRIFRFDAPTGAHQPNWDSGVVQGLGYIWAKIEAPGLYVAIGLPRDRLMRQLLRDLAFARSTSLVITPDQSRALVHEHLIRPLATMPLERLEYLREMLAADDAATGVDPPAEVESRRGHDGEILPPPLPGGISVAQMLERARALQVSPRGLPEEALVSLLSGVSELPLGVELAGCSLACSRACDNSADSELVDVSP